jgi:hypothetical protein
MLWNVMECYGMLLYVIVCYGMLLYVMECYCMLWNVIVCYGMLLYVTECCVLLLSFSYSGCSKMTTTSSTSCKNINEKPYFSWWTVEENSRLQEHGTMWIAFACSGTNHIDNMLYIPNPIHKRISDLDKDVIHHGMGWSGHSFKAIDFTIHHKKYLVLKDEECKLEVETSFDTLEETKEYIRAIPLDNDNEPDYYIVNLSKMCFEFNKEHNENNCFTHIYPYSGKPLEELLKLEL